MSVPSSDGVAATETNENLDVVVAAFRQVMTTDVTTILDALLIALQRAKDLSQVPKEIFHTVIVPDVGEATVTTAGSFEEMLATWREARQKSVQIFGFHGDILLPSKGGHYVVTPWGRYPLFAEDASTEVDLSGRVGPDPSIPHPVAAAVQPASGPDDDNEEIPGDDDNVDDDRYDDDDGFDDEPEDE
jgi:hypothetical protein